MNLKLINLPIAEWDDDMTYLYVEYPLYKKFLIGASLWSVSFLKILLLKHIIS